MDGRRLEISGAGGSRIGHVEWIPLDPAGDAYKIVIQLGPGFQVLALRSEMCAGRISGILSRKAPLKAPDSAGMS